MEDPRLTSWLEMCSIRRAFLHDHPSASYQPTTVEWHEMVATYLAAPSPLAARLGVGRTLRDRSGQRRRRVTLDRWGLFLAAVTSDGDDWRLHHDAVGHVIFSDALHAGIIGSTEVRGIFADLLPRPAATSLQSRREGLVPDARLSRTIEGRTAEYLHDLKVLHCGAPLATR